MNEIPVQSKREEIVSAAYAALLKHGLPPLSYEKIAEVGGLSRQLVKYYFPDSETLMLALCDKIAAVYRDNLVRLVREAQGKDRMEIFFDFYFDLLEGAPKPQDDQVYDALFSVATANTAIREQLRSQYTLVQQVLSQELQVTYPQLGVEECDNLGYLFVCLMYGHWKMVASLGFDEACKTVTRDAIDRLLASYLRGSAPTQAE